MLYILQSRKTHHILCPTVVVKWSEAIKQGDVKHNWVFKKGRYYFPYKTAGYYDSNLI